MVECTDSDAAVSAFIPLSRKSIRSILSTQGVMHARRYTVVIADRSTGVVRRLTVRLGPAVMAVLAVMALPVLMGLGAKWSARVELDHMRAANASLDVENGSYRAATGELTAQIQSLETVINDLGARASLDPAQARAMQKLPAVVKTRAAGGTAVSSANQAISEIATAALSSPEDTFGVLRDLLHRLESRLRHVRRDVERREARRHQRVRGIDRSLHRRAPAL